MAGISLGMVISPSISTGTFDVAPQGAGVASATVTVAQQLGASIGTSLVNTIFAGAIAAYLATHPTSPTTKLQLNGQVKLQEVPMKKLQRAALAVAVTAAAVAGSLAAANAASAQPAAAGQSATDAGRGGEVQANERVVQTFLHEVVDDHDGNATAGLVTSDVAWHGGTLGVVSGRANVEGLFTSIVTALPDLHSTVFDVMAQGDQVVVRQILTGTQQGAIIGIPASGRVVTWDALDLFVLRDGKIRQIWAGDDWTAILNDTGTYKAPWIG